MTLKTQPNDGDVQAFVGSIDDERKRDDCSTLLALMKRVTHQTPTMWGEAMVGFGRYEYTYASGRSGEWFSVGFAPRKQNLTVYLMDGFDHHQDLLAKLGKYSTSKSCLYIKRLSDVDLKVLEELVGQSFAASDKFGAQ